ncbi:MAG: SIR2 family NAD-dependent protein deacylase [Panacagrimonas sp.]
MQTLDPGSFDRVVFFTGAGMSAESGMPTYRGVGGVWSQYNYQEYACQAAFDRDPEKVLDFHEVRRATALSCPPHAGHLHLAALQARHPNVSVITQNIDGLLQRAGVQVLAELHGSLWRQRCRTHGVNEDRAAGPYRHRRCPQCNVWLRPDITWFHDGVDEAVFRRAGECVRKADLFVSVGTSGVVWPAAGFAEHARQAGAHMVEINPEDNEASVLYATRIRLLASAAIPALFPLGSGVP